MYTVQRAIIMAAGRGSRLRPLTDTVPKPLIKIAGVPLIERTILTLHQHGITEIYVVVGYRKAQFAYLARKYPGLILVTNPYYATCNNVASLYMARHHLENAMILDGDQLIQDPSVLAPDFEASGYLAAWQAEASSEWLLTVKDRQILRCHKGGTGSAWRLFSVSRWTPRDAAYLKLWLEHEFAVLRNQQIFWDDVALFLHPEDFKLQIVPMAADAVVEIDSLEEFEQVQEAMEG